MPYHCDRVSGVNSYSEAPLPDALDDAAPSTKLVFLTLYHHGPLSRKEIARYTGLNPAGLHRQIAELDHHDLLKSEPIDGQQRRYNTTE